MDPNIQESAAFQEKLRRNTAMGTGAMRGALDFQSGGVLGSAVGALSGALGGYVQARNYTQHMEKTNALRASVGTDLDSVAEKNITSYYSVVIVIACFTFVGIALFMLLHAKDQLESEDRLIYEQYYEGRAK